MKIKKSKIFYSTVRRVLQAVLLILFLVSLGISILSEEGKSRTALPIIFGFLFCISLWAERHTKRWEKKHVNMDPKQVANTRNRTAKNFLAVFLILISLGILAAKSSFDLGAYTLIVGIVALVTVIVQNRQGK